MSVKIIAEAGSNWCVGGLEMAYEMIDVAAAAGADIVKFQVYRAETTYAAGAGECHHLKGKGVKGTIREIFKSLEMPDEMIPKLAARCEEQGVEFMASVFSKRDFLAIDPYVKAHKVASPELHDPTLLDLMAKTGKPIYLSTGISTLEEIERALTHFPKSEVTLLQCTVQYPTDPQAVNLRALETLKGLGRPVGLSDHTRDVCTAPIAAVAMGASVIEKHYTLSNDLVGPDHSWAITGPELADLVRAIRRTETMLGSREKSVYLEEADLRAFSMRRLHAMRPICAGETLHLGKNVAFLRTGHRMPGAEGLNAMELIGSRASRSFEEGEGIE